jgi:hypothetical protein
MDGPVSNGERFIETIVALKNGAVIQDFGERLSELVKAVRETARGGALTITIKVSPATAGSADVVVVEADVKERIPRPSLGKTVFFTTQENLLVRENPQQMTLRMGGI